MQMNVVVDNQNDYKQWLAKQKPWFNKIYERHHSKAITNNEQGITNVEVKSQAKNL
jgi:heme/copper-type cytochrome/quinol oxidase subunit 2